MHWGKASSHQSVPGIRRRTQPIPGHLRPYRIHTSTANLNFPLGDASTLIQGSFLKNRLTEQNQTGFVSATEVDE
jgi:hypothetical protein